MTKNKNYKKHSKQKSFLRKRIDIIESFSISAIQAKIIFWIFSILLVFDFLILPIIFGYKNGSYECEILDLESVSKFTIDGKTDCTDDALSDFHLYLLPGDVKIISVKSKVN